MHANCFKGLVLHRIVNCLIVRLITRLCECFSLADGSGPLGKSITCLTGQRDLPWSVWWTISDNGPDLSVLHSTVLSWTSPKPPFAPRLLLATQGVVWTGVSCYRATARDREKQCWIISFTVFVQAVALFHGI